MLCTIAACQRPPNAPLKFYPVGMNPQGPHFVSDSGGVAFWGNGSLRLNLYLEKGPVEFTVRAGGNVADGEAPKLQLWLDGALAGVEDVRFNQPRDYVFRAQFSRGSTKQIELRFENFVRKEPPLASRILYIEWLSVYQPD